MLPGLVLTVPVWGLGTSLITTYTDPYPGLKCAGKRFPDVVFQLATAQERATIIRQCEAECALLARLRHPNIVQFLGVHYDKGSDVPTLVTECMHTSLNACINRHGVLPDEVAFSILHDIALALHLSSWELTTHA